MFTNCLWIVQREEKHLSLTQFSNDCKQCIMTYTTYDELPLILNIWNKKINYNEMKLKQNKTKQHKCTSWLTVHIILLCWSNCYPLLTVFCCFEDIQKKLYISASIWQNWSNKHDGVKDINTDARFIFHVCYINTLERKWNVHQHSNIVQNNYWYQLSWFLLVQSISQQLIYN